MTVTTNGDVGDVVYLLGILSALPNGPHTVLYHDEGNPRGFSKAALLLAPLVRAQPYIKEFRPLTSVDKPDWRSEGFRDGFHQLDQSLICSTWNHGKTVLGSSQHIDGHQRWLENVPPDPRTKGKVVIARSPRYHNDLFPWERIVGFYGRTLRFIGLPKEHADFEERFGRVQHIPVSDFMEMASLIAGSELFIGNQSAPNAIAEGLKHPRIQETSLIVPDCIYLGGDVQHVVDGAVRLPGLGDEDLVLSTPALTLDGVDTSRTPPGTWFYDCGAHGEVRNSNLELAATEAAKKLQVPRLTIRQLILQDALRRHPGFFASFVDQVPFQRVRVARERAGIS